MLIIKAYNDGKCKHQSQEMHVLLEDAVINGEVNVNINSYGADLGECKSNLIEVIEVLKTELNKLEDLQCVVTEDFDLTI